MTGKFMFARCRHALFAIALLVLLRFVMIPIPTLALTLSRGFQTLPIGYQECLTRAYQALRAEGYNATPSTGASFVGGFRGPHGAYITCGLGPTQQSEINVFVATEGTNDAGLPGNERTRLQQHMAQQQPATPQPVPPPAIKPPVNTPPATTPLEQSGNWSGWFNLDDPGGNADYEWVTFPNAVAGCPQPIAVECRVRADKRDWRQAGQRYKCAIEGNQGGGICLNSENPGGCLDYEVRFSCPVKR